MNFPFDVISEHAVMYVASQNSTHLENHSLRYHLQMDCKRGCTKVDARVSQPPNSLSCVCKAFLSPPILINGRSEVSLIYKILASLVIQLYPTSPSLWLTFLHLFVTLPHHKRFSSFSITCICNLVIFIFKTVFL